MTQGFEVLDFNDFHRSELPLRLSEGNGALAAGTAKALGSLAFRLNDGGDDGDGDEAYTYVARGTSIDVLPGDENADTVVALSRESWEGLVHDLESPAGLLYGGLAKGQRGDMMQFVGWEPCLRAMYTGRPIYDAAKIDLRNRDGSRLDPGRSFRLDDNSDDMIHFLRTAGYIRVRDVFDAAELATLRKEAAQLQTRAPSSMRARCPACKAFTRTREFAASRPWREKNSSRRIPARSTVSPSCGNSRGWSRAWGISHGIATAGWAATHSTAHAPS
ncbi:MAG: hypothetical protein JRG94_04105 [Deltaproteobacteria bacterium]|nr:hypothetical protein [Deltaproteobacteria bacterium]